MYSHCSDCFLYMCNLCLVSLLLLKFFITFSHLLDLKKYLEKFGITWYVYIVSLWLPLYITKFGRLRRLCLLLTFKSLLELFWLSPSQLVSCTLVAQFMNPWAVPLAHLLLLFLDLVNEMIWGLSCLFVFKEAILDPKPEIRFPCYRTGASSISYTNLHHN